MVMFVCLFVFVRICDFCRSPHILDRTRRYHGNTRAIAKRQARVCRCRIPISHHHLAGSKHGRHPGGHEHTDTSHRWRRSSVKVGLWSLHVCGHQYCWRDPVPVYADCTRSVEIDLVKIDF